MKLLEFYQYIEDPKFEEAQDRAMQLKGETGCVAVLLERHPLSHGGHTLVVIAYFDFASLRDLQLLMPTGPHGAWRAVDLNPGRLKEVLAAAL